MKYLSRITTLHSTKCLIVVCWRIGKLYFGWTIYERVQRTGDSSVSSILMHLCMTRKFPRWYATFSLYVYVYTSTSSNYRASWIIRKGRVASCIYYYSPLCIMEFSFSFDVGICLRNSFVHHIVAVYLRQGRTVYGVWAASSETIK